ncbi:hypothetical protein AB0P19_07075 [Microbacterium oleivorans]|uniref:hypothetical protein n=1 Tax=Microbacterium oleivorans TaxID=273677 RepID=UPI0034074948
MSEHLSIPESESRLSRLTEAELIEQLERPLSQEDLGAELQRRLDAQGKTWRWIVEGGESKVWVLPKDDETLHGLDAELEASGDLFGKSYDEWHTQLTGENLAVPASRYGRDASEVAWWAVASMIIGNAYHAVEPGEEDAYAEHAMSSVVNDHESFGHFVKEHLHLLPQEVIEQLDLDGTAE